MVTVGGTTLTTAVALAMFAALAAIVDEPAVTPVTGIVKLVAPAGKLDVGGAVALEGSLEVKFTIKPPVGARPPVRITVTFPEPPAGIEYEDPEKAIFGAVTATAPTPGV